VAVRCDQTQACRINPADDDVVDHGPVAVLDYNRRPVPTLHVVQSHVSGGDERAARRVRAFRLVCPSINDDRGTRQGQGARRKYSASSLRLA
jgi:hypothetical protein